MAASIRSASGRMSSSSTWQPSARASASALDFVPALVAKPGMVMAWMCSRPRPRRSTARAATMRAWVESSPPLTPMTIRGSPMARSRWTRAATWML